MNKLIEQAFTLIELLVVIAIIGILSGLIMVSMNGITDSANDAKRKANIDAIKKALVVYGTLNGQSYPIESGCNIGSNCTNLANALSELLPILPRDPVSGYYSYFSNGTDFTISANLSNNNVASYSAFSNSTPGSCLAILNTGKSTGSGLYWINPLGIDIQAYCDMTTNGGGWTLVLQSNSTVVTPAPNWNDAINNITVSGTLNSNLTTFDALVGLGYWNKLGTQLMVQVGSSPASVSHRATYSFSLNPANFYSIGLSNQKLLIGTTVPGLYSSHNNKPFTTYDADHDASSGNCAASYNNHPWWYISCWSGNFFAGGSYQDAPYWNGAGSDYYPYGSIFIR